jgi:hypothetical protein
MNYPTLEEVERADRLELCRWYRFLPSPGSKAVGRSEFYDILHKEKPVMDRIVERMNKVGGFTPEISKAIGWAKD